MSSDDATIMTRDAGASRTFRSIFGESHQELQEQEELKIHHNVHKGDGGGIDDDDDDDEALWFDDAAPKERSGSCSLSCSSSGGDGGSIGECGEADCGEGEADQQHKEEDDNNRDAVMDGCGCEASGLEGFSSGGDASAPRSEETRTPHRRSMEEWADDDEEEDTWKDMLQAKVNQLELVIQSNNDAVLHTTTTTTTATTATASMVTIHPSSGVEYAHGDSRIAAASEVDRPANRHKIQRTSSLHCHAAMPGGGDGVHGASHHHHKHLVGVHAPPATALSSSPSNYLRKRSGFRDSASAGNAKAVDSKKVAKMAANPRRESRSRPSSTSSISTSAVTRPSNVAHRKSSLDASSSSNHHSLGHGYRRKGSLDDTVPAAATAKAVVCKISDAEAVRRFVMQDIKQMSMDRLVNDAKRLHFLDEFFTKHEAAGVAVGADVSMTNGTPLSPASVS